MSQSSLAEFKGRILTSGARADMLQELVRLYPGNYVEIGTAYGSSAILAALADPRVIVHCIDPMDGMYGKPDAATPDRIYPTPEILEANCRIHMIDYGTQVILHQQKHPPWPEALKDYKFGVGYIDADHSKKGCRADFKALRDRCQCIIFDNYEKGTVRWVVKVAVEEGWTIIKEASEPNPDSKRGFYGMAAITLS